MATICFVKQHDSPFGSLWSSWTDNGLYSLNWDKRMLNEDKRMPPSNERALSSTKQSAESLDDQLANFFAGLSADFECVKVDSYRWTPFTASVYKQCRKIPSGATISYKELADRAGNPRASRAVGSAMARNRIPIVIPCHRVISSSGALCGFSAPGGLRTKQFLLDLESQSLLV
ncbi:Methylated-DNA--protein-cysteine methyltransferase [Planctomycetes bacterium CA13]|uniref:methylated-DNA--[protein]-cysteine S-methyltransferase n=1 Tax=Novipirellula herctigrandis TaxID=2527986 RepID=A0A5C5YNY1_9BACT|nr:Methylated-DNA--protein-cysteine methyltransferase [Planctomycetes bacterium CA13]